MPLGSHPKLGAFGEFSLRDEHKDPIKPNTHKRFCPFHPNDGQRVMREDEGGKGSVKECE